MTTANPNRRPLHKNLYAFCRFCEGISVVLRCDDRGNCHGHARFPPAGQARLKSVLSFLITIGVVAWVCCFSFPAYASDQGAPFPTSIGSGSALEGDLVSINGNAVKLWGIDAPDLGQTCFSKFGQSFDCALASKNALATYIGQSQITCYIRGKNSHGQQIGTCGVGGADLAALMIRDGYAMSFRGLNVHYDRLQAFAQARKRGLWDGRFEAPWIWRSKQISSSSSASPSSP